MSGNFSNFMIAVDLQPPTFFSKTITPRISGGGYKNGRHGRTKDFFTIDVKFRPPESRIRISGVNLVGLVGGNKERSGNALLAIVRPPFTKRVLNQGYLAIFNVATFVVLSVTILRKVTIFGLVLMKK